MILAVDTSGRTASCAVAENGVLLGYRMLYTQRAHSQILLPMVKDLLAETGHTVQDVDVFAAANGPGSYTGLRIGIAAMQALGFAGGKQCAGISSLEGLAWNLCGRSGILCACLAARKDLTEDKVLPAEEIAAQIAAYKVPVMVIGDGLAILKQHAPADYLAAPMHLCNQSACGIAMAAMHTEPVSPDKLTVSYLQAVKIG